MALHRSLDAGQHGPASIQLGVMPFPQLPEEANRENVKSAETSDMSGCKGAVCCVVGPQSMPGTQHSPPLPPRFPFLWKVTVETHACRLEAGVN